MKRRVLYTYGLIVLGMIGFAAKPAHAQTIAPGPYYAIPSWDQTLPSTTRFIVLSNMGSAAVLDRETGVVWERSPNTSTFVWGAALSYCNNLNVGGRTGWRLPTIQELMSLVDLSVPVPPGPRLPSGHPFTNVQSSFYWSGNTATAISNTAWSAPFGAFGTVAAGSTDKGLSLFTWCVRGGQAAEPQ